MGGCTHLTWTRFNVMCCGSGMSQEAATLAETWCLYTVSIELCIVEVVMTLM